MTSTRGCHWRTNIDIRGTSALRWSSRTWFRELVREKPVHGGQAMSTSGLADKPIAAPRSDGSVTPRSASTGVSPRLAS